MFSKELNDLIEASLADGVIDDKEKAVLVKRAQKEGVDVDELEIYIKSIMQKRLQKKYAEEDAREESRIEVKKKEIGKVCPHCGTPLPPLAESCPACGTIILTAAVNEKIEAMIKEVNDFYSKAIGFKVNSFNTKKQALGILAKAKQMNLELKTYYSTVPKVQVFTSQMDIDIPKAEIATNKRWTVEYTIVVGVIIWFLLFMFIMLFNPNSNICIVH